MTFIIGISVLNLFIALGLSPLFEGVARKLRATVHSRIGPPVIQPYYDLLKLLGKEQIQPSGMYLARLAPWVCFSIIATAALLVPMGTINAPLGAFGDSILFIYIITLVAVTLIITATASESPFAFVGASREMMMHLTVEPVLVITLLTAAVNAHSFVMGDMVNWYYFNGPSLSMIAATIFLFLALQAQVGKLPFDIAEADQEVMGGPFIEQSGPQYALLRWMMMAKQIIFASLFVQVFIPWPRTGNLAFDVIIHLAKVLVLVIIIGVIDVVNPRLRIDQSIKYYLILAFLSLSGIAFAVIGA
jgi:formate hydrogenlyase subunit 4